MKVKVLEFGKPGGLQLMKLPASSTKCQACATEHDAAHPHNAQSLYYQYWFYEQHQRWPNWNDAMAHCSDEMKKFWTESLIAAGVDVAAGKINPS